MDFGEEIGKVIAYISDLFSDDALVSYALAFTIVYAAIFSLFYFSSLIRNLVHLWACKRQMSRKGEEGAYEFLRQYAGLDLGSIPTEPSTSGSTNETSLSRVSTFVKSLFLNRSAQPRMTRARLSLAHLLHTLEETNSDVHRLEGIRPADAFLVEKSARSNVPIERAFTVLTQLSLAVTFAGLAAVLVIASGNIAELAKQQADAREIVAETEGADTDTDGTATEAEEQPQKSISDAVLEILKTAGSKFWITAFAYGFGLMMLLSFYAGEKIWNNRLRSLGKRIEGILDTEKAQEYATVGEGNLSQKQKNDFQKILTENAENIASIGKEVNDKLIEKLGNIAKDNKFMTEALLSEIHSSFDNLAGRGLRIHIQEKFSSTVNDAMKNITDEVSFTSKQISEYSEEISKYSQEVSELNKSISAFIEQVSSDAPASKSTTRKTSQKGKPSVRKARSKTSKDESSKEG